MTTARLVLEHFDGSTAALLHAAQSEADAARERALAQEAEEQERAAEQRRVQLLTQAIARLAASSMDTRASAIEAIAEVAESAIQTALPMLARQGFSAELGLAVKQLVESHEIGEPELVLSANDHDTVTSTLAALEPAPRIQVLRDEGLADGTARLRWRAGGASVSTEDLATKAVTFLQRRIDLLSGRKETDDR